MRHRADESVSSATQGRKGASEGERGVLERGMERGRKGVMEGDRKGDGERESGRKTGVDRDRKGGMERGSIDSICRIKTMVKLVEGLIQHRMSHVM